MSTKKENAPINEVTVDQEISENELLPQLSDEQIEFARISLREEFNKKYSKWAEIAEEKADDDFIKEAKHDLEEATKEVTERQYLIAEAENSRNIRTAQFLLECNSKFNKWKDAEWRGIIKFDEIIKEHIKDLTENPDKNLYLDYASVVFLYTCMPRPYGVGLESARLMAKFENYDPETGGPAESDSPVTYSGILERIYNYINEITAYDKKFSILKQRLDLAYATAKMNIKCQSLEEYIEFYTELTATPAEAESTKE